MFNFLDENLPDDRVFKRLVARNGFMKEPTFFENIQNSVDLSFHIQISE